MSSQTTSKATRSATSLQASAGGALPRALQVGQMNDLFGQVLAPASRSQLPAKAKAKKTSATSGQNTSALSVPERPLSSWESRLRQRLSGDGWTNSSRTWRASTTPAGRSLSRLSVSMPPPPIDVTGCGSLPTPSGTSNHGKNHVSGRIDEWGGSSNYFRGKEGGNEHLPGFELWTMGFPEEWRLLMPPAMPSSRKSRPKSSEPTLMPQADNDNAQTEIKEAA